MEVLRTYADGAVDVYFWTKSSGLGCSHKYHLAKDGAVFVLKVSGRGNEYRTTITSEPRIRRIRKAYELAREAAYQIGQGVRCPLEVA